MAQKTSPYLENIISLDVQQLCHDRGHGEINFLDCSKRFAKVKNWAERLEKCEANLDSGEYFSGNFIENFLRELHSLSGEIKNFNPTRQEIARSSELRDEIAQKVKDYFNTHYDKMSHEVILAELAYNLKKADEALAKFENAKDVTKIKNTLSEHSSELKKELVDESEKRERPRFRVNLKAERK
jgi:hypothetical protein